MTGAYQLLIYVIRHLTKMRPDCQMATVHSLQQIGLLFHRMTCWTGYNRLRSNIALHPTPSPAFTYAGLGDLPGLVAGELWR